MIARVIVRAIVLVIEPAIERVTVPAIAAIGRAVVIALVPGIVPRAEATGPRVAAIVRRPPAAPAAVRPTAAVAAIAAAR